MKPSWNVRTKSIADPGPQIASAGSDCGYPTLNSPNHLELSTPPELLRAAHEVKICTSQNRWGSWPSGGGQVGCRPYARLDGHAYISDMSISAYHESLFRDHLAFSSIRGETNDKLDGEFGEDFSFRGSILW